MLFSIIYDHVCTDKKYIHVGCAVCNKSKTTDILKNSVYGSMYISWSGSEYFMFISMNLCSVLVNEDWLKTGNKKIGL